MVTETGYANILEPNDDR